MVIKVSGSIDEEFIVDGSFITAKLISDDSVTDSGVKVEISNALNSIQYKLKLLSKKVLSEDKGLTFSIDDNDSEEIEMVPLATNVYTDSNRVFVKFKLKNPIDSTTRSYKALLMANNNELNDINKTMFFIDRLAEWTHTPTGKIATFVGLYDIIVTNNGSIVITLNLHNLSDNNESNGSYYPLFVAYSYRYYVENFIGSVKPVSAIGGIKRSNILYANDKYKLFFSEYISNSDFDSKVYLCRDLYKLNENSDEYYWIQKIARNINAYKITDKCNSIYEQSDFTKSVATFDNNFYRGTEGGKLIVYNLDTKSFDEQYSIDFNNSIEKIVISKDKKRLYLALGKKGIAVLDISNPQRPVLISSFDTKGYAYDLAITNYNKIVYVADGANGVVAIDAHNPNNLKQIDNYKTDDKAVGIGITNDDSKVIVADVKDILVLTTK